MLKKEALSDILSLYEKYGWQMRRVLLTEGAKGSLSGMFDANILSDSDIDAVWFSRAAKNGGETWELRHLCETPYALLEVFDADEDEEVRDETLIEIQDRLKQAVLKK